MNKKITINDQMIDYKIRKSKRAKRLRIAVYRDASVVVTMPRGITASLIEKFLREKSVWLIEKINYFKKYGNNPFAVRGRADYLKNKNRALALISERIEYFNKDYNLSFNKISIKNQKTRWGSCSQKRNLNFNYKIVYLPKEMADYIIVHELCHLKEFNHSKRFWNLVAKALPDYLEIKKRLRKEGLFLK
ncbi:M48 family metallopeptidase [Candidatus Parcubacteria bacterium]|nr:M48 family metallopeptidase [Candidatus Parcubacteria bacterium]